MTMMATINRWVVPAAVNGFGAAEVATRGLIQHTNGTELADLVRRNPATTLSLAALAGLALGRWTLTRLR